MLKTILNVLLLLVGLFGLLVFAIGLWMTFHGGSIAFPGLGLILGAVPVMLFGMLIVAAAYGAYTLLNPRRRYR
ncbi:MAG: hypothetical protein M3458_22960 [Acidobacteriota bacterium]|nr:hypothetical protein [Acidobacteriota bacterium]